MMRMESGWSCLLANMANLQEKWIVFFSIDSISAFLPKGDSVAVECSYRELEEYFPKIQCNDRRRKM